ncbi:hypothetical protein [Amycolatopsis alba]|uniref:hypothetical protein n=1 Tax=Amycolatopsis alba TaxID=76020 RepID=UPI00039FE291|nr:hypothetical protein [Amycolatopsis alba]
MTTTTAAVPGAAHHTSERVVPLADLVDKAAVKVSEVRATRVDDGLVLDREDAGPLLSDALGRHIVHRCSPTEHWFVDVQAGTAVRLVVDRSDPGHPVAYMAQSPSPGSEPDLYRQLVDAARSGAAPAATESTARHDRPPHAGPKAVAS